MLATCCCWHPAVAGNLLLLATCCCWQPAVAGYLMLLASCCSLQVVLKLYDIITPCCCQQPAVAHILSMLLLWHPAVAYISYCSILTSAVFKFKKMKSYQGYTDGPFYQLTKHTNTILFVIFSSLLTFTTEIQNSHKIRNFSKRCMSARLLFLLSCYSVQFLPRCHCRAQAPQAVTEMMCM